MSYIKTLWTDNGGEPINATNLNKIEGGIETAQNKLDGIENGATADQTKVEIDALGINAGTVNGKTVETSVPAGALFTDTETTFNIVNNILTYTNEKGIVYSKDLSLYLDDTNLARLVNGVVDSATGIATFTRDDNSTFTVDMSALIGGRVTEAPIDGTPYNRQDGGWVNAINKTITPVLSGVIYANEATNIVITINNYTTAVLYRVIVSIGTYTQNGATISWSLPSVTVDTLASITVTAEEVGILAESDNAVHNLTILNVLLVADQSLVYDSVTMGEFTTVSNITVNTVLDAVSINTNNIIDTSVVDSFNTGTEVVNGDIINVDGSNMVVDGVTKNIGTISNVDPFGDGSGIVLYEFENNTNDTGGLYNATATNITYLVGNFGLCVKNVADWTSTLSSNSISSGCTFDASIMSNKTALTFSCWFKTSDNVAPTIITGMSYNGSRLFNIFLIKSNITNYFGVGGTVSANSIKFHSGGSNNTDYNYNIAYTTPINQWVNFVAVLDGANTWSFYSNGALIGSITNTAFSITGTSNTGDVQGIGCLPYTNITSGDTYDQVRIFNKALTTTEITTIYHEQAINFTVPTTVVTAGITPNIAYINEHRVLSNVITQDTSDTNFAGLTDIQSKLEFPNISDVNSTANTLITTTKIVDGDSIVILLDNEVTYKEFIASGVVDNGDGSWTLDTTYQTNGEIPTRVFAVNATPYFKINSYNKAVKVTDNYTDGTTSIPILKTTRTYNDIEDIISSRTLRVKEQLSNIGTKMINLTATIQKLS